MAAPNAYEYQEISWGAGWQKPVTREQGSTRSGNTLDSVSDQQTTGATVLLRDHRLSGGIGS